MRKRIEQALFRPQPGSSRAWLNSMRITRCVGNKKPTKLRIENAHPLSRQRGGASHWPISILTDNDAVYRSSAPISW